MTDTDSPYPGLMQETDVLEVELRVMRATHRSLDEEIQRLVEGRSANALLITKLKRRKLALKDAITRIEDRLFPDIIA